MKKHTLHDAHEASSETLIFLHVPKTGGISVSQAIVRQFREDEVFHVRNAAHEKSPVFASAHGTIEDFRALSVAQRRRYRCILGHMHFGLHEHVPGPAAYVTLLRDPVERLLSHFGQYCRMVRNQEFGDQSTVPSLEEFCRIKSRAMDNHQTRFLCGWEFDKHPRQASLDRARENLSRWFRVVGTMERFDETLQVLHRAYAWPDMACFRENVSSDRLRREQVAREFLTRVEELNWLDRELHALADSLLDDAIAVYGRSPRVLHRVGGDEAKERSPSRRPIRRLLQRLLTRA